MAKLVTKFKYLKPNDRLGAGGYAKYIATREGVEKIDDTKKLLPATKKQKQLIANILKDYPDTKGMLEYEDYQREPTIGNASELITRVLEENQDEMSGKKTYADYIATRPGAERFGTHGLFTTDGVHVDLKQVSEELNAHRGNVWTAIISLRRPDAERLGFNTGSRWKTILRSQQSELSTALNIPITNLKWFAAFHNESHHPHVHLIIYSKNENEGYLTPKGVRDLRSSFARDIFMQDNFCLYEKQTEYRDKLRVESGELISEIGQQIESGGYENPVLEEKLKTLAHRLSRTKGKKVYGYLKADVKALVNSIVDELEKDDRIASLYALWYEQREEIIRNYTEDVPKRVALSANAEFKSVRNAVIKEAVNLGQQEFLKTNLEQTGEFTDAEDDLTDTDDSWVRNEQDDLEDNTWWTDRYKEARRYLSGSETMKPDFVNAESLLREEAEAGNGFAAYDLGLMYLQGKGVNVDPEKAHHLCGYAYKLCVEKETTERKPGYLRYRIGKMYALGYGVEQDDQKAAEWYQKSLEDRNALAAYALGSLYRRGKGVPLDMEKAFSLFTVAAEDRRMPSAYAAYELGAMCKTGLGTTVDEVQSEKWYCRAFHGFLSMAGRMQDEKLFYRIGMMCMEGIGTEVCYLEAEQYLKKAAEMEHEQALYRLGKLYLIKANPAYDPIKAVSYLELAAARGNSFAWHKLGCLYFFGTEVDRDREKGIAYLKQAAELGNDYAVQLLELIREEEKRRTANGVWNLFLSTAGIIRGSLDERMKLPRYETDRKLKRKIQEKKEAQGLKQG